MSTPAIHVKRTAPKHVFDPAKDELVELVGDPADPSEGPCISTYRLPNAADAKVLLLYDHPQRGDLIPECEVYVDPTEQLITLHMICPHCLNSLTIPSSKKKMSWDKATGLLSVEESQCTWEAKDEFETERRAGAIFLVGKNLCGFRFAIENNVIRRVTR